MTETPNRNWLSSVRRYRRLFWGCFVVAILGFVAGISLGYPLVGLGVYWAGFAGMLAISKGTSLDVFDEREQRLERRASHITLSLVGVVLVLGGPGQIALAELGYELTTTMKGALYGYAAQFGLFGVVYLVVRYRP